MKIELKNYETKDFECSTCHWNGKGRELSIETISEEHWIIDFECPKCGEHIGSGQAELVEGKEDGDN